MKTLRALKGHTYASKFQKVGAIYDASDSDANLLVLLKNSEYFTVEMALTIDELVDVPEIPEPKAKRPYVRRNLQADKPAGYSTKEMKAQ